MATLDLSFYPQVAQGLGAFWAGIPIQQTNTLPAWQWMPALKLVMDGDLDTLNQLIEQGWERLAGAQGPEYWKSDASMDGNRYLRLVSTLEDVRLLQMPGKSDYELWAHSADIRRAERVPVTLAWAWLEEAGVTEADFPDGLITTVGEHGLALIHISQLVPPPNFGEIALVDHERDGQRVWEIYTLAALGDAGRELWQRIGETLKALAAPGEWWPVTPQLAACLRGEYPKIREALRSKLLATRGKEREAWRARLIKLETDQKHAIALQTARERARKDTAGWLAQWEEVRRMAAELAEMYWQAHQDKLIQQHSAVVVSDSLVMVDAVEVDKTETASDDEAQPQERRKRGARVPQAALVVKDPAAIQVKSDIFTQGIIRALRDGDAYIKYPDRQMAEYSGSLAKRKGDITITITPGDDENWDHVLIWLNTLGDEMVDTFIAVMALAIDENGVEGITAPFWHRPDDGLAICQRKKSNRAYTPDQRAAWIENLRILSRMHIRAESPGARGRTRYLNSALIDVFGQAVGEYKTITGEPVWEKRQVKVGEWAKIMGAPYDKQMAATFRKVLSYHAQRERYAKRLGLYFNLQFRANAKRHDSAVERTMATLLEQAGVKPDLKHPGDTRRNIEDALAKLRADGVIGAYSQIVDSSSSGKERQERIEQRAYGWWDDYLTTLWRIEPPEAIRQQYRAMLRRGDPDDGAGDGQ